MDIPLKKNNNNNNNNNNKFIRRLDVAGNIAFRLFLLNLDKGDHYPLSLFSVSEHRLFTFSVYIPELVHYQSQN